VDRKHAVTKTDHVSLLRQGKRRIGCLARSEAVYPPGTPRSKLSGENLAGTCSVERISAANYFSILAYTTLGW
jgi:hypothetical protein